MRGDGFMFKIGEFSRLSRVSVRMLRHYDKLGLLAPDAIDPENGYRLYSVGQLRRANKITTLRDMGFLVEDIKRLVELDDEGFVRELDLHEERILSDIEQGERRLADVRSLRDAVVDGSAGLDFEVSLKAVPSYEVIALRMALSSYDEERRAWEALGSFVKEHDVPVSDPYVEFCEFDSQSEADEEGVTVEVAVAVDELREGEGPVRFYRTDALSQVASIMVYGPYENIAPVYTAFAQWLEGHPLYEMAGNTREIAHRGCWNTEDPSEYVTEFQIPVHRRSSEG